MGMKELKVMVCKNRVERKFFADDKRIQNLSRGIFLDDVYDLVDYLEARYKVTKKIPDFKCITGTLKTGQGYFNSKFIWDNELNCYILFANDNGRTYNNWSGLI
jgi:hypothetical protein